MVRLYPAFDSAFWIGYDSWIRVLVQEWPVAKYSDPILRHTGSMNWPAVPCEIQWAPPGAAVAHSVRWTPYPGVARFSNSSTLHATPYYSMSAWVPSENLMRWNGIPLIAIRACGIQWCSLRNSIPGVQTAPDPEDTRRSLACSIQFGGTAPAGYRKAQWELGCSVQ